MYIFPNIYPTQPPKLPPRFVSPPHNKLPFHLWRPSPLLSPIRNPDARGTHILSTLEPLTILNNVFIPPRHARQPT